ncbi:MAG: hypothetical protein ABGF52_05130 [Candidatus Asgardarchaeum sp.]
MEEIISAGSCIDENIILTNLYFFKTLQIVLSILFLGGGEKVG